MDTRQRGDLAEAAVLRAFVEAGLMVLTPFSRFGPYDLMVDLPTGRTVRVQVKSGRLRKGCVEFNSWGTDHGNGPGRYDGRADVFAVHVHQTGEQYVIPVAEARASKTSLRVVPARNNQLLGIRQANDYRLADWVAREVGVAA